MWGSRSKASRDRKAKLQGEWTAYREAKSAFVNALGEDAIALTASNGECPLLLVLDASTLHWVELADGKDFKVLDTKRVPLVSIGSVRIEQATRLENYRRKVVTPVAVIKKKSAVGRGVVGAALLGPVGLLLGAASAITPESKVVGHETMEDAVRVGLDKPTAKITCAEGELSARFGLASTAAEFRDLLNARGVQVAYELQSA